jgi:hypothetical protein
MMLALLFIQPAQMLAITAMSLMFALLAVAAVRAGRRVRRQAQADTLRSEVLNQISSELRFRVYERDGYACQRCGAASDLQVEFASDPPEAGPVRLRALTTRCARCAAIVRQSHRL